MAGAAKKMFGLSQVVPIVMPLIAGSAGYAAYRVNWGPLIREFLTGPGRTSRILLLFFIVFNWKSMPFAWTYRVFYTIFLHGYWRKSPTLGPDALFKPMISTTHAPILEIDYNLHKSNSTYFADLDVSRSHLVTYLCRASYMTLANNAKTKLVLDPKTDKPIKGNVSIILGSVACSFKREIPAFKNFEMWSRILCWDRKWLYIVTHYIPKGAAKPTSWLDPTFKDASARGPEDASSGWHRRIYATAISKYVFKLGRFTVNPAILLGGASGLLPERPGGWTTGPEQLGDMSVDLSDIDLDEPGEWDWRRVEAQRRRGVEYAKHFQELDTLHDLFDGGNEGALGKFAP